jgi:hypothetical protein
MREHPPEAFVAVPLAQVRAVVVDVARERRGDSAQFLEPSEDCIVHDRTMLDARAQVWPLLRRNLFERVEEQRDGSITIGMHARAQAILGQRADQVVQIVRGHRLDAVVIATSLKRLFQQARATADCAIEYCFDTSYAQEPVVWPAVVSPQRVVAGVTDEHAHAHVEQPALTACLE